MTMLDSEIRRALTELVDAAPPPPSIDALDDRLTVVEASHRPQLLLAAIGTAVIVCVGLGVLLVRSTAPSATESEPPASPPTVLQSDSTVATTSTPTSVPPTQAPSTDAATPRLVGRFELDDVLSKWSIDPQQATAYLGTTGTIDYWLDLTDDSLCIRREDGSSACLQAVSPASLAEPQGSSGGSGFEGNGVWAREFIMSANVTDVRLNVDGVAVCSMQRFSLEAYGDAAVWACEGVGQPPETATLEVTEGDTVFIVLKYRLRPA